MLDLAAQTFGIDLNIDLGTLGLARVEAVRARAVVDRSGVKT